MSNPHQVTPANAGSGNERPKRQGLFEWIKFVLLGFGISSPDERRENFRKWEQYRRMKQAEERQYGGTRLDDAVRAERERAEPASRDRVEPAPGDRGQENSSA